MKKKEQIERMTALFVHVNEELAEAFGEDNYFYAFSLTSKQDGGTLTVGNLPEEGLAVFLREALSEKVDALNDEQYQRYKEISKQRAAKFDRDATLH